MLNLRLHAARNEAPSIELPRPFSFVVTWSSVTAGLKPREITSLSRAVPVEASVLLSQEQATALVVSAPIDVAAAPATATTSGARWEMVVPKMVRTSRGTFERVDPAPQSVADDRIPEALPAPMFANYARQPLFSRALSLLGRRNRALLPPAAADTAPAADTAERIAAREQWLSRITKTLRNRPADKGDKA